MRKPEAKEVTKVDPRRLARDVDVALRKGASAKRAAWTKDYFPSQSEILGVATPHLRAVVKEALEKLRGQDAAVALEAARRIVQQGTLEGRQTAYEILCRHPGALEAASVGEIEELGEGIDNWCSVDGFGCFVSGQAWRRGRVTDRDVVRWSRLKDLWWRRAAAVSTVPLNARSRGGQGDTRRTLMVLTQLSADREPMVAKAVSWALRGLIESDRAAVVRFLADHDEEVSALVKREVGNKLRTGLKNPRGRKRN